MNVHERTLCISSKQVRATGRTILMRKKTQNLNTSHIYAFHSSVFFNRQSEKGLGKCKRRRTEKESKAMQNNDEKHFLTIAKSSYTAALRSQHCYQHPSGKATVSKGCNRVHIDLLCRNIFINISKYISHLQLYRGVGLFFCSQ